MLFDIDGEHPAKRRLGGWYDEALVTIDGESRLAELDNFAIAFFRKNGFLFSMRRDEGASISGFDGRIKAGNCHGFFEVPLQDTERLKLFSLSLLWRAAASQRPEFRTVKVTQESLEEIRSYIMREKIPKYWEFPVVMSLFNNHYEFADITPTRCTILRSTFYRWCLDGVILYTAAKRRPDNPSSLRGIGIGYTPGKIRGLVIAYDKSSQKRFIEKAMTEHIEKFGSPYKHGCEGEYPHFEFDPMGQRTRRLSR